MQAEEETAQLSRFLLLSRDRLQAALNGCESDLLAMSASYSSVIRAGSTTSLPRSAAATGGGGGGRVGGGATPKVPAGGVGGRSVHGGIPRPPSLTNLNLN